MVKLAACGNQSTQSAGEKSTRMTRQNENAASRRFGARKRMPNTCAVTTEPILISSSGLRRSSKLSTRSAGSGMRVMKLSETSPREPRSNGRKTTQERDLLSGCESTVLLLKSTVKSLLTKVSHAPSADDMSGLASTIVTVQVQLEGCCAPPAISALGISTMTQNDSSGLRHICGILLGKRASNLVGLGG